MSNLVHGIDLSAVPKKKNGARIWTPKLRAKIVALTKKIPLTQVAEDLQIHPVLLQNWRSKGPGSPRSAVASRSKGKRVATSKVVRKGAAKRGPYKKKRVQEVLDVLPETVGIVAALRKKHQSLVETAAHVLATIGFYENGGGPVETVRLSDAQVDEKPKRRLSKAGKAAISKAAKKRWAIYKRNNKKK